MPEVVRDSCATLKSPDGMGVNIGRVSLSGTRGHWGAQLLYSSRHFDSVQTGKTDVQHDQIRSQSLNSSKGLHSISDLSDDPHARTLLHSRQDEFTPSVVVLHYEDSNDPSGHKVHLRSCGICALIAL
jgi:hypothetical protein